MQKNALRALAPGDPIVRIIAGSEYGKLWRNEGRVLSINKDQIVCEISVDQPRAMEFHLDTGVSVLGSTHGWIEIPGAAAEYGEYAPLLRFDIVQILWQAKNGFDTGNSREEQDAINMLVTGIRGMTEKRPAAGAIYERMQLVKKLYRVKGIDGPMGDLPDILLDYMTTS